MRNWNVHGGQALLLWVLIAALQGPATAQLQCPVQPYKSCEKYTPPELMRATMSRGPADACEAEGSLSSPNKKCVDLVVRVVAMTDDMPRCWAILDYSGLNVSKAKRNTTVSWKLDISQAPGHKFDAEGIRLTSVDGSASAPATTWRTHSSSNTKYKIKIRDEKASAYCHFAQVKDPDGVLCCPADPVIANQP